MCGPARDNGHTPGLAVSAKEEEEEEEDKKRLTKSQNTVARATITRCWAKIGPGRAARGPEMTKIHLLAGRTMTGVDLAANQPLLLGSAQLGWVNANSSSVVGAELSRPGLQSTIAGLEAAAHPPSSALGRQLAAAG